MIYWFHRNLICTVLYYCIVSYFSIFVFFPPSRVHLQILNIVTGKVPVLPHQILHQVHVIVDNKSVIFDGEALIVAMEARHVLGLGKKKVMDEKKLENKDENKNKQSHQFNPHFPFSPLSYLVNRRKKSVNVRAECEVMFGVCSANHQSGHYDAIRPDLISTCFCE